MKQHRIFVVLSVLLLSLYVMSGSAVLADVGVRPLSMGGAFVGLADDANATYWNPAGLVQLKSNSLTYNRELGNSNLFTDDDFLSFGGPIGNNSAYGISWIRNSVKFNYGFISETIGRQTTDDYTLSFATRINKNTSLGINISNTQYNVSPEFIPGLFHVVSVDTAIDLGIFSKISDKFTVGLLIEDFNEPKQRYDEGQYYSFAQIWRPGIAYHPDASTTLTMDLYDALDKVNSKSLRVGYEKKLDDGLVVRAGLYDTGTSYGQSWTFGVGKKFNQGTTKSSEADICVITGDIDTVIGSYSYGF